MDAALQLKQLERRISPDLESDADWLRTRLESGQVAESMRYSNEDIARYGLPQVRAWVEEDHLRLRAFENGDWWFVNVEVVAVVAVMRGDQELGRIRVWPSCVGGIESDSPQCHLDELAADLTAEVRQGLKELGFAEVDSVATVDVPAGEWVTQTW